MGRLAYLSKEDLPEEDRALLDRPINLYRMLANSPGSLRGVGGLGEWIRFGGALEPRLRELVILTVGYLSNSSYEYSHHVKISYDFGVTEEDIRQLVAELDGGSSTLGELERLAVSFTRQVTTQLSPDDATWDALRGHLSDNQMTELVVVAAYYNMVVRVLASLQIDVEPDYQQYLSSPVAVPWLEAVK